MVWMHWQTHKARGVWGGVPRRAMHASCESPCHSSAKRHLLDTCLLLMTPFRSMLLTLQSGLKSLAPRARWIPVYPVVFLTFLHAAYTAHEACAPGRSGPRSAGLRGAPEGAATKGRLNFLSALGGRQPAIIHHDRHAFLPQLLGVCGALSSL